MAGQVVDADGVLEVEQQQAVDGVVWWQVGVQGHCDRLHGEMGEAEMSQELMYIAVRYHHVHLGEHVLVGMSFGRFWRVHLIRG